MKSNWTLVFDGFLHETLKGTEHQEELKELYERTFSEMLQSMLKNMVGPLLDLSERDLDIEKEVHSILPSNEIPEMLEMFRESFLIAIQVNISNQELMHGVYTKVIGEEACTLLLGFLQETNVIMRMNLKNLNCAKLVEDILG